jgi:hypothetical protein
MVAIAVQPASAKVDRGETALNRMQVFRVRAT